MDIDESPWKTHNKRLQKSLMSELAQGHSEWKKRVLMAVLRSKTIKHLGLLLLHFTETHIQQRVPIFELELSLSLTILVTVSGCLRTHFPGLSLQCTEQIIALTLYALRDLKYRKTPDLPIKYWSCFYVVCMMLRIMILIASARLLIKISISAVQKFTKRHSLV